MRELTVDKTLQIADPSVAWRPGPDYLERANVRRLMDRLGVASYEELLAAWTGDVEAFWAAVSDDLGTVWRALPERTLDRSRGAPWPTWFPGGTLNLVETCLLRHDPDRLAVVWEGEEGAIRRVTYGELASLSGRIAGGLRDLGVGPGDRVGMFMPSSPEALASLYACAQIGAVLVPTFSGFGAEAVAARLRDAGARVLLTADGALRRGRPVDMRAVAEEAAAASGCTEHVIVWPRLGDGDWDDFLSRDPLEECVEVPSDHPFLIAYTSGTTGVPKGAVHVHGGFPLKCATEIQYHCDQREGELLFWMSDPGWIVSPICQLGAGYAGRALLLYDGAPDFPGPSRVADLLRRHEVALFGASPTFVRALMRQAEHGFDVPVDSLRVLVSSGEPWNDAPWWWFFDRVGGGRCPIVNLSGGTEAGSLLGVLPIRVLKPCSFNTPCVGIDASVLGADGEAVGAGEVGELVVGQPWPGMTKGVWGSDERYLAAYWERFPDVWTHGDWATRDADGSWKLLGRSDDTINVAGKRIGPAELETILVEHPAVVEAAAVGVPHPIKGEGIWCFVVARAAPPALEAELAALIVERLGKPFGPERVISVDALPKTRSGKVVRRSIRAAVAGSDPGDLSTLENPGVLDAVRVAAGRWP